MTEEIEKAPDPPVIGGETLLKCLYLLTKVKGRGNLNIQASLIDDIDEDWMYRFTVAKERASNGELVYNLKIKQDDTPQIIVPMPQKIRNRMN